MDRPEIDVSRDSNGLDVGGDVPPFPLPALSPQKLDLPEAAKQLKDAAQDLRVELTDAAPSDISALDQDFLKLVDSPAAYGMVRSLQRHGVDSIEVAPLPTDAPREVLREIFNSGQAALREHGIPDPDLAMYEQAAELAQSTGRPIEAVVAEAEAAQPLAMRGALRSAQPNQTDLSISPAANTVGVERFENAFVAPDKWAQTHQAQNLGDDFEPTNYQEYDVHLMGFPIKTLSVGDVHIPSSASHGFIAVTERGMDPEISANVLLATRAGPDHLAARTMFTSDSSLPADTPSETEKTHSGNLYVSNHDDSKDSDVEHEHAFFIKTIEVDHDLGTMEDLVNSHARMINFADIDYELLNKNSNTYYGDITEILTGEEPPDFSLSGGVPRYFPAINNDLVDYSKTEFAENFGYEPVETKTNSAEQSHEQSQMIKEDDSYGID